MLLNLSNVFALSQEFVEMLNIVGVPRYNVFGEEINEQIYYNYQEFVYSSPERITDRQRWKNVYNGKWTRNGVRGEYFKLGREYNGNIAYNFFFPVDRVPTTTPDRWQYQVFNGAYNSWVDMERYNFKEQIDHMLYNNILFDKIDFANNTTDPHTLIEYNITPNQIGKDKCMLDVLATWKTYGSIVTKRKINGIWWTAVFRIKPMSANARIQNVLKPEKDKYIIESEEDSVKINITAGSEVKDLEGYASPKHINQINTKVYINNREIANFSSSQSLNNIQNITANISRDELKEGENIVKIKNSSFLKTSFAIDGLLKDNNEVNITIIVKKKKPKDPLQEINIKKLVKKDGYMVDEPCKKDMIPVFQAGQHILTKLKFSDEISNLKIKNNFDIHKINSCTYIVSGKINIDELSTISSIKDLRNQNDSYFNINRNELEKRISINNAVELEYEYQGFKYKRFIEFDILGDIITNFNFQTDLKKENIKSITVEDWINEN